MQLNDRIKAIIKVQLALNYLKLCADHENPTGGGVPVDIVTMPDFVVDVDGYAVTQLNENSLKDRLAAAEVGSRAGRILSILAHLRDLDDESFRLHYLAKTGAVGRALLEKRLNTDLREKSLQPLRFPFLIPAKDTRYAVLGRSSAAEKADRQIVKNEELLTPDDLMYHFYNPLDVISNAAAVYFGTDSADQFSRLIDLVIRGLPGSQGSGDAGRKPPERYVFVDFSAMQDEPLNATAKAMTAYRQTLDCLYDGMDGKGVCYPLACRTRLIVMVMSGESTVEQYWQDLRLRDGTDTLLVYDTKEMVVLDNKKDTSRMIESIPYALRPGPRDAFIAGFLLHRAIAAAWERIPDVEHMKHVPPKPSSEKDIGVWASQSDVKVWTSDWSHELFPNPYTSRGPDVWPLSEAVDFGAAVAALWSDESDTDQDKRNLLFVNLDSAEQRKWSRRATPSSPHIARLLNRIGNVTRRMTSTVSTSSQAASRNSPRQFFLLVTLLTKLWLEGDMNVDLATQVGNRLFALLNADLAIQPTLWAQKDNRRSLVLRLPCLATARTQFVLDTLRRMSMDKDRWKTVGPKPTGPDRACLFDLDGTLIQSSGLRRMCLRQAFLSMLSEDSEIGSLANADKFPVLPEKAGLRIPPGWKVPAVPEFLDRCETLYHLAIYNRSDEWSKLLGSYTYYAYGDLWKDFRQVWNHPLSYPVFARVLEICLTKLGIECSPLPVTPASVLVRACGDGNDCHRRMREMLADQGNNPMETLVGSHGVPAFHRDVAIWEAQFKRTFQAATTMYWNRVEYEAIPHTRHVLRVLRDVLSVKLYVATEGHHETQLAKLRTVRLDDFFPEYCTLSTGAAATPTDHVRSIAQEMDNRSRDIASLQSERRGMVRVSLQASEVIQVDAEIAVKQAEVAKLESYQRLWTEYEEKQLRAIYSLILSCIMADPDKPMSCLTNIRTLELVLEGYGRRTRSLSFTMIGDRESKDIRPLLQSWEEDPPPDTARADPVTTIRLLTKDHMHESLCWLKEGELNKNMKPNDKPLARYVAWNPLHVILFLATPKNWPKARGYHTLPPIMRTGLLIKPDGTVDETSWSTMAWGEAMPQQTFALMNRILTRCSIQGPVRRSKRLADTLVVKFQQTSPTVDDTGQQLWETGNETEYDFAWVTVERLLAIVTSLRVPRKEGHDVASAIRNALCGEIKKRVILNDRQHESVAVNLLRVLAGKERNPPLCEAPSDWRTVWAQLSVDAQFSLGRRFFEEWAAKRSRRQGRRSVHVERKAGRKGRSTKKATRTRKR